MSEKESAVRVITSHLVWIVRIGRRKRRNEMKIREAGWDFMAAENFDRRTMGEAESLELRRSKAVFTA